MRQTAKLQHHYYHTSEFYFPLCCFEPISHGARIVRFELDITDRFCMHQTAKLQYHYYHTSEFDSPLCSSFCYTGNKTLVRLAIYATQGPTGVRSVFFGSDGR